MSKENIGEIVVIITILVNLFVFIIKHWLTFKRDREMIHLDDVSSFRRELLEENKELRDENRELRQDLEDLTDKYNTVYDKMLRYKWELNIYKKGVNNV